jgi:hypothetical protein
MSLFFFVRLRLESSIKDDSILRYFIKVAHWYILNTQYYLFYLIISWMTSRSNAKTTNRTRVQRARIAAYEVHLSDLISSVSSVLRFMSKWIESISRTNLCLRCIKHLSSLNFNCITNNSVSSKCVDCVTRHDTCRSILISFRRTVLRLLQKATAIEIETSRNQTRVVAFAKIHRRYVARVAIWERVRAQSLRNDSMKSLDALTDIRRQTFETTTLQRWEKNLLVNVSKKENQMSKDEK